MSDLENKNYNSIPKIGQNHSASTPSGFGNRLAVWFVIILGVIAGPVLGAMLANGDFFQLALTVTIIVSASYIVFFSNSWLLFAWFVASLGLQLQPVGFLMGSLEISALLAGLFIIGNFWKKSISANSPSIPQFKLFQVCFVIYSIYLLLHGFYNILFPFNNETLFLQNSAKTYFFMWGGFFLVWVATLMPQHMRLPKNPQFWFGLILAFGLAINIGIRLYSIFVLRIDEPSELTFDNSPSSAVFIPFLNATENVYALRTLGPISALFSITLLTSNGKKPSLVFWLLWFLLVFGFGASLISGGRATAITALLLCGGVLFLRRRLILLLVLPLLAIPLVLIAKLTYEYDQRLVPLSIQRTLALIPFMDMQDASSSIQSSSDWRYELFQMALVDWQQSARTIFTGRSGYAWTSAEVIAGERDRYYGIMQNSLRRGATHNLFTDLAVTVGLVGFLLYCCVLFSIYLGILKLRRLSGLSQAAADWHTMVLVYLPVTFLSSLIGGVYFTDFSGLLTGTAMLLSTSIVPLSKGLQNGS